MNTNLLENSSMEDFKNTMTVFYRKKTGDIFHIAPGRQDFNFFGEIGEDYELILDMVQIKREKIIMENWNSFKIDLKELTPKFKENFNKYI
ncbi:hypothetical protein [Clostridium tarantellae]|uniref:Uncharacterized protein n=1 Tax=Clostridium tarantellae TaxID=39493 RepID=A0A6I1MWJ4_9CLOT|nr:hypothetical protein [Clostridium tarantellae]MPQ45181.1 hypothetical protein [Clostridium tarantellae]